MYIHQDGRYFAYDTNSIEEEDFNPWHDSRQHTGYGQNDSTPQFSHNTTSYSLYPKNQEEIVSNLPFVQTGNNLLHSDPRYEIALSNENFEKESKNNLQLQISQENSATLLESKILSALPIEESMSNDLNLFEKQANDEFLEESMPNNSILPWKERNNERIEEYTSNVSNIYGKQEKNERFGETIKDSFSTLKIQKKDDRLKESLLDFSVLPWKKRNNERIKEFTSNVSNIYERQENNERLGETIKSIPSTLEIQENDARLAKIDNHHIIINKRPSFDQNLRNSSHNGSFLLLNRTQRLHDDVNNKINESSNFLGQKLIFTKAIDYNELSTIETTRENYIPSNGLSLEIPSIESKILEPQINPISFVSKNNSNKLDIYLNSSVTSPSQHTLQLDSLKCQDLNENQNQNNLKTSLPLDKNSQEIEKSNRDHSLTKMQLQSSMALYIPQKYYSKWIQKLIIIPHQHHGCHDITLVLLQHLKIELLYFKCGVAQLFLQHTSASLVVYDKNDVNNHNIFASFEKFLNKLLEEEEKTSQFQHVKGLDIMLAQFKSAIFGCSLTIPITNGKFNLGLQQIICLHEHQNFGNAYNIIVTLYGEGCSSSTSTLFPINKK